MVTTGAEADSLLAAALPCSLPGEVGRLTGTSTTTPPPPPLPLPLPLPLGAGVLTPTLGTVTVVSGVLA